MICREDGATKVLAAMDVTSFRMRWMMGPGIATLVGVFVGFVARVRVWQTAVLGAVPFAFSFSDSWSSRTCVHVLDALCWSGGIRCMGNLQTVATTNGSRAEYRRRHLTAAGFRNTC